MTRTILKKATALTLVLAFGVSACADMDDHDRTVTEGAAGGAVLGALVGLAAGGDDGRNAAVGAVIGGLIGAGVGKVIADRKAKYASMEDYYDGQIATTEQWNGNLAQANTSLSKKNKVRAKQIAALESQAGSAEVKRDKAQAMLADVSKQQASAEDAREKAKEELDIQQAALDEMRQQKGDGDARVGKWQAKVDAMRAHVAALEDNVDALASQDKSLSRYL